MKVLIGYDGSADSVGAIRDLARSGLPAKAQALVLTVTTPWQPQVPGVQATDRLSREAARVAEASLRSAAALAEEAAAQVKKLFPGWKVKSEAVMDSPAEGLIKKAEAWKPDLLVLGSHGRTAIGRLFLGSVSEKVLQHAPADVRITRPRRTARSSAPRILVAVDGSPGADHAVSAAAARQWPKGTKIRVIAALDGDRLKEALEGIKAAVDAVRGRKRRVTWVEQKAEAAVLRLSSPNVQAVPIAKVGDPRIAILREARDWGADCIFLGSRGLGGIERFVMGSVSSSVAAHAPCTVEIIRKQRPPRRPR